MLLVEVPLKIRYSLEKRHLLAKFLAKGCPLFLLESRMHRWFIRRETKYITGFEMEGNEWPI